jgi:hypothetical protein
MRVGGGGRKRFTAQSLHQINHVSDLCQTASGPADRQQSHVLCFLYLFTSFNFQEMSRENSRYRLYTSMSVQSRTKRKWIKYEMACFHAVREMPVKPSRVQCRIILCLSVLTRVMLTELICSNICQQLSTRRNYKKSQRIYLFVSTNQCNTRGESQGCSAIVLGKMNYSQEKSTKAWAINLCYGKTFGTKHSDSHRLSEEMRALLKTSCAPLGLRMTIKS